MPKIDYSQYYIKNYIYTTGSLPEKPAENINIKKKPVKKTIVILLILAILTGVAFGGNYLLDGELYETVKSWILQEESTVYYLLVKAMDTRERAYAQSLLVRQGGASGYVFMEEEKYYVSYSVFTEEKDATAVAVNNEGTEVIKRKIISEDSEFYNFINASLLELIKAAEELEAGSIYEAKLLEISYTTKAKALEEKQRLYELKNPPASCISVLDLLIGGLDSLSGESVTRVSILSDLRYIISAVIMTFN